MEQGPRWSLVYLQVDADEADCHGGEAILHDGRAVGLVSSGAYGYFTGKSLAFGFVQADCIRRGSDGNDPWRRARRAQACLSGARSVKPEAPAMSSMTGGEAVYRQLTACGVTAAFGVIGGSMLEL